MVRQAHPRCGWIFLSLLCGCAGSTRPPPELQADVWIDTRASVAEVRPEYLSVALDVAQLVGGEFWSAGGTVSLIGDAQVAPIDLERLRLIAMAKQLSPGLLRVGGSAADLVFYDLGEKPRPLPPGYRLRLDAARWEALGQFADQSGLRLMFTLNAGPGPRDRDGRWHDTNARELLQRGGRVAIWELGNEPNAFPLIHRISARTLGDDLRKLRAILPERSRLAGPASAYWPRLGEFNAVLPRTLRTAGDVLDVVTWHYYPQQSRRCPVATRRAGEETLLDAAALDEFRRLARQVERHREEHAPGAELWLGETGNAQCGGEPGVSDRFVSSLWWLDELGAAAREGHRVVIRQALTGADYGLLDERTLEPRPDFWASLLWKRLMGTKVLTTAVAGSPNIRAWAHCNPGGPVTAVLINLGRAPARIHFEGVGTSRAKRYAVTAANLTAKEVQLNGATLRWSEAPAFNPDETPLPPEGLRLPPTSYTFVQFQNRCPT